MAGRLVFEWLVGLRPIRLVSLKALYPALALLISLLEMELGQPMT